MNKGRSKKILLEGDFTLVNLIFLFRQKLVVFWISIIVFLFLGFVIYSTTPNSYRIQSVYLIEAQEGPSGAGGLGSLAQLSGINMGSNNAENTFLNPALYPVIVQSKPFLEELMKTTFKSLVYTDSVTLFKYMVETRPENSIMKALKRPQSIFKSGVEVDSGYFDSLSSSQREQFSPLELYALGQIAQRISISSQGSLLNIDTEMPEPDLSFQFSKKVKSLIEKYSIRYVLEKQNNQVEYLKGQFNIAEKNYQEAQNNLVRFKERNQGINLESLRAVEQNFNAEYNLKFELFRTISQELELAKIKLNSLKPIFSQIEPPYIPNRPTSPRLLLTLAFSFILGIVAGTVFILFYYTFAYFKLQQNN
ncbi:MAG: hypothetical protein HLUCCX10_13660 [Algoriphagus marincola HL-49]|uniref:Polysaccharide chain length determinant N-terminal domain-containing protein n=1 Tax=Algoriphagus marincola HL-49 TaxID=1305737 RepID=A0A0P7Y6F4_9BACT|nr:MAG: hypothetical protein HLUCCX10_13660 [Algoriphagus marincola HL-49]